MESLNAAQRRAVQDVYKRQTFDNVHLAIRSYK